MSRAVEGAEGAGLLASGVCQSCHPWVGSKRVVWPRKVEEQLEVIHEARTAEVVDETHRVALTKALQSKTGLVVATAARVIGARSLPDFEAELFEAFGRLIEDGAKRDPNCRGKLAIIEALAQLGADAERPLRQGLRLVQREPVWGTSVDTAAELRAACARLLVDSRAPDVLARLTDLLADPERAARIGAVNAMMATGRPDAALPLRLKARLGDVDGEVVGACFEGVLALDDDEGVEFVAEHLDAADPVVVDEALVALGNSRRPHALAPIFQWLERIDDVARMRVAHAALVSHRSEEGLAHLASRLAEAPEPEALAIAEALAPMAFDPRMRARVRAAVAGREEPALLRRVREAFEEPVSGEEAVT